MDKPSGTFRSYVLSIILINEPSALVRVIGLFSARGYNIESQVVAPIGKDKEVSRLTVVCSASAEDETVITQICHQIERLIPVVRVRNLTRDAHRADSELALLRLDLGDPRQKSVAMGVASRMGATVEVYETDFVTFRYVGNGAAADALVFALSTFGNVAESRSGLVSLGGRHSEPAE